MNGLTTLLEQRGDALVQALLEHVQISVLALLIAVLISVPLGLYLTRHERIAEPIIGVKAGFTLEFKDREDGYAGLQKEYGLALNNVKTMEPKLRYNAVQTGDINLLDAYAIDPEIEQYDLAVLEDDEKFFPPYQGAPVLRAETLKEHPELKEILNKLAGKINDKEMRKMNYEVNAEGKTAEEVARKFLVKKGLVSD